MIIFSFQNECKNFLLAFAYTLHTTKTPCCYLSTGKIFSSFIFPGVPSYWDTCLLCWASVHFQENNLQCWKLSWCTRSTSTFIYLQLKEHLKCFCNATTVCSLWGVQNKAATDPCWFPQKPPRPPVQVPHLTLSVLAMEVLGFLHQGTHQRELQTPPHSPMASHLGWQGRMPGEALPLSWAGAPSPKLTKGHHVPENRPGFAAAEATQGSSSQCTCVLHNRLSLPVTFLLYPNLQITDGND